MTAVVVSDALANKANSGGAAWIPMSWVRGLERLGLDVWFVEELRDPGQDGEPNQVQYFRDVVEQFGLSGRAALLAHGAVVAGPPLDAVRTVAESAVLVNYGGHLRDPRLFPVFRTRVMVDGDPGFTQFWHAAGERGDRVPGHDLHFTVGVNIGASRCPIPTAGIAWRPVRQPVVMSDWPLVPVDDPGRFTTVANWRGPFGPVEFSGRTYGLKVHEFRKFIDLPLRTPHRFELALNIHGDDAGDLERLREHRWRVTSPEVVATPDSFRSYVQGSGAEFSAAQGIYVDTTSGWFSDRSARYLASGRPVLVQDTGLSPGLPLGRGLLAFRTIAEAAEGAAAIVADYPSHCAAARSLAARYFDSDHVLARFCEQVGL